MTSRTILVVDDEQDMRQLLKRSLAPDLDCRVDTAPGGETALQMITQATYDLVLADIKMPGMDGLELLDHIKQQQPALTVVMMTAFGQVDTAVAAMKSGAYDFITKPFEHDTLIIRLEKALERSDLLRENRRLHLACKGNSAFEDMAGKSAKMKHVFETIQTVAKTDLTVLITGESGVGKDLTARAIHSLSKRCPGPFVAVNCPTIPEHILESELFGYKKGAFTHATQNKIGLFQEAHGGTIFLDEIGDITPTIQTKLLRVLQDKIIKPLGDTKTIPVDVRIITSTNRDLQKKIQEGQYREDFFYRLNVLPIRLPPLRERVEDIPLIANHLLQKHCREMDRELKRLSPELLERFMKHPWVGNVREMENLILQGIIFSTGDTIQPADAGFGAAPAAQNASPTPSPWQSLPYKDAKAQVLQQFNEAFISDLLKTAEGNVTQAARECGLERQALQQIMRRYGITADPFRAAKNE